MRSILILCLYLCLPVAPAGATSITVVECVGAHGERLFGDRRACAAEPVRTLSLTVPPAQPVPAVQTRTSDQRPARQSRRSYASPAQPDSYRCASSTRTWYQHSPCRNAATGRDKREGKVTQTRVPRSQACHEIARPAALLRKGSERDDRAGPYARATGRDPCR